MSRIQLETLAPAPILVLSCVVSLLPVDVHAQAPQSGWVWGWNNLGLVITDRNFTLIAAPGHPAGGGPGADFSIDSGWQIWELSASGGPLYLRQFTPGINAAPVQFAMPTQASWMTHDRRRVWLLGGYGALGYIDKSPLTALAETSVGNVCTALGLTQWCSSMCSNGRDLFFAINVTANDTHHIFSVDTQAAQLSVRPLAAMPLGGYAPDLTIGPNGALLTSYLGAVWEIDPETGTVLQLFNLPVDPWFPTANIVLTAFDPWTDEVAVAPRSATVTYFYTRSVAAGVWQPRFWWPMTGLGNHACVAERPYELYGKGCSNIGGSDPRLGWSGMPQPGSSFSIRLRDAEPGGVALSWLGLSEVAWGSVGSLPLDLGVYGAPGCRILASADATVLLPVDPQGRAIATYGVPLAPALVGTNLFGQTLSSNSTNALGLGTSDAVLIRVR